MKKIIIKLPKKPQDSQLEMPDATPYKSNALPSPGKPITLPRPTPSVHASANLPVHTLADLKASLAAKIAAIPMTPEEAKAFIVAANKIGGMTFFISKK